MRADEKDYIVPEKVEAAIEIICVELSANKAILFSKTRRGKFPDKRKILAYLLKLHFPKWSKSVNLGRLMNRDHSTILVMWDKAKNLIETEAPFRELVERISDQLDAYKYKKPKGEEEKVEEILEKMVKDHVISKGFKNYLNRAINKEKTQLIETL